MGRVGREASARFFSMEVPTFLFPGLQCFLNKTLICCYFILASFDINLKKYTISNCNVFVYQINVPK